MFLNNIWDFWAASYERLWVQKYSLGPTRQLVLTELGQLAKGQANRPLKHLDVGCGTGQLIEELVREYGPLIASAGLDFSNKMVALAAAKNLPANFILGDAHNLPFAAEEFDILTCCHSFPYYQNKPLVLQEFFRVLKPGGYLLLINASVNNLYDQLVMAIVKLTTGKASYPSTLATSQLLAKAQLTMSAQKRLACEPYMPSIVLTIATKGLELKDESSTGKA